MHNSEKKNDAGLYLTSKLMFIHKRTSILPLPLCVTFKNKVFFLPRLMIENDILLSIDILLLFNLTEEADQKIGQLNLHYIKSIYPDIELQPTNWGALILQLAHVAIELEQSSGRRLTFFSSSSNPIPLGKTQYTLILMFAKSCHSFTLLQGVIQCLVSLEKGNVFSLNTDEKPCEDNIKKHP